MTSQTAELKHKYEFINLVLPHGFSPYVPEIDDGIDFILHRRKDDIHLNVQLKSRWTVDRKYFGRNIWIAFPCTHGSRRVWYLVPHDLMVALAKPRHGHTTSWKKSGYSKHYLPKSWEEEYRDHEINFLLENITPSSAKKKTGHANKWSK